MTLTSLHELRTHRGKGLYFGTIEKKQSKRLLRFNHMLTGTSEAYALTHLYLYLYVYVCKQKCRSSESLVQTPQFTLLWGFSSVPLSSRWVFWRLSGRHFEPFMKTFRKSALDADFAQRNHPQVIAMWRWKRDNQGAHGDVIKSLYWFKQLILNMISCSLVCFTEVSRHIFF